MWLKQGKILIYESGMSGRLEQRVLPFQMYGHVRYLIGYPEVHYVVYS